MEKCYNKDWRYLIIKPISCGPGKVTSLLVLMLRTSSSVLFNLRQRGELVQFHLPLLRREFHLLPVDLHMCETDRV